MTSQRYNQSELVKGFLLQEKHKQMMRNWGTYSGSRLSTADKVGIEACKSADWRRKGHRDASINSDHHVVAWSNQRELFCSAPKKKTFDVSESVLTIHLWNDQPIKRTIDYERSWAWSISLVEVTSEQISPGCQQVNGKALQMGMVKILVVNSKS